MSSYRTQPGTTIHIQEFDSEEMARRGRLGALRLHSTHDPRETTKAARAAFRSKFEHQVDPDCLLPIEERQRRAEFARREFFTRIAHKSAEVRKARKHSPTPTGA